VGYVATESRFSAKAALQYDVIEFLSFHQLFKTYLAQSALITSFSQVKTKSYAESSPAKAGGF
jgi:hypothetical protein